MSNDQQQKNALRRLTKDLEELQQSPVNGVSASPLDDNMFEWHCNFLYEDAVFHLILFFPNNYPLVSPSAEFVPYGFDFPGGASAMGKKGVKVCLSIFSDFEKLHPDWKQMSVGWSPAYTVQTILLNLVSFLSDYRQAMKHNKTLAEGFVCTDCGHSAKKPHPPMSNTAESQDLEIEIIDYISRLSFSEATQMNSDDEIFGFGVTKEVQIRRPTLNTPCEYLTAASFDSMLKTTGGVLSVLKTKLNYFLPLCINEKHAANIKARFEKSIRDMANDVVQTSCMYTPVDDLVLQILPKLMNITVVQFADNVEATSERYLAGYFSLHQLFLWAINTYPHLQRKIDERIQVWKT